MIQLVKTYRFPLIITFILFLGHLCQKNYSSPYERPIAGDAQAYYAYLPALFIYQDLSYDFVTEINATYYPSAHQKSFLIPSGNGKVNKTFPGVAFLYLPFFLIAHALALLFDLPADGYSTIYQICFDIGLWVYLCLGLIALIKVLRFQQFSTQIANWTAALLLFGTNLVFYSVYDQSVTHIYNFFLINTLILLLFKFQSKPHFRPLLLAFVLLALIGITRPTNILVVGLILFFFPNWEFYKTVFSFIFKLKNLLLFLFFTLSILAVPFLLWKAQTGNWIVYSYGEEGFDFTSPHFIDFLFSYLKGWFVYTPLAFLLVIPGFVLLFKRNRFQFFIGLFFYIISVYIFSSWWCWYYGAGMGQRVMIDHYILLAFLLALVLQKIAQKGIYLKVATVALATLCILFNTVQAYQIRYGILPGGVPTKTQYWDTFLVLEKRARIYPYDHWILEQEQYVSLNINSPSIIKGQSYIVENEPLIQVSEYEKYTASISLPAKNLRKGSKFIVRFEARARDVITETRLVILVGDDTKILHIGDYTKKDNWVIIEYMIEPLNSIKKQPIMYFWNGETAEKVEIKNIMMNHYFSEDYL